MTARRVAYALGTALFVVAAFSQGYVRENACALGFLALIVGTIPRMDRVVIRLARETRTLIVCVLALPLLGSLLPAAQEVFATLFYIALIGVLVLHSVPGRGAR